MECCAQSARECLRYQPWRVFLPYAGADDEWQYLNLLGTGAPSCGGQCDVACASVVLRKLDARKIAFNQQSLNNPPGLFDRIALEEHAFVRGDRSRFY